MRTLRLSIALGITCFLGVTSCKHTLTDQHVRRDEVLGRYFSDEAAEALASVPLRSIAGNPTKYRGIAIGDDPLTRLWSVILGFGDARQVVVSEHHLDDDGLIIHEYLHQADYSGLIDRRLVLAQFALLKADPEHLDYATRREDSILRTYGESLFGQAELILFDGLGIELVAFIGNDIATGRIVPPPYLWEPFAAVLRMPDALMPPVLVAEVVD